MLKWVTDLNHKKNGELCPQEQAMLQASTAQVICMLTVTFLQSLKSGQGGKFMRHGLGGRPSFKDWWQSDSLVEKWVYLETIMLNEIS